MTTKQIVTVEEVAETLIESAKVISLDEFELLAGQMLEDSSPGEIAAIGRHLPPALRERLPKRILH